MSRLLLIFVTLCWLQLFNQIRVLWSANEQYGYAWFVPFLAAALLWRRWRDQPGPEVRGERSEVGSQRSALGGPWSVVPLLALLLPFRVLEAANRNWNMLYWIHALTLLGMSLGALWLWGGRAALRHYSFPILFLLTSLAWPSRIDEWVIQGLMRQVAGATVVLVGFFDIPALREGNVIEISTGRVGIDDACSGIRSLQSSIMFALLLGELFRLRPRNRVLLLPSGILLALFANVGRTSFLTWSAAKQGFERMHAWHGPAGLAVVGIVMGGLLLLAWLWRERPEVGGQWSVVSGQRSEVSSRWSPVFLILCCLWVPITEGLTRAWYHWPGKGPVAAVPWTIQWPTNQSNFQEGHISAHAADGLRCTANTQASWMDQHGNRWGCVILHWAPVHSLDLFVGGHKPEICMTATGSTFLRKAEPVAAELGAFSIKFSHCLFEEQHRLLHVFQGTWEPFVPPSGQRLFSDYSPKARIRNALQRHLVRGGTTLEFALVGPATEEEAKSIFQKQLAQLIVPTH